MAKTANINVRIAPETKASAEQLFANFCITVTDAINIFLRQSLMVGGLVFEMKQSHYNALTEVVMQEARDIVSGKVPAQKHSTTIKLMENLDSKC